MHGSLGPWFLNVLFPCLGPVASSSRGRSWLGTGEEGGCPGTSCLWWVMQRESLVRGWKRVEVLPHCLLLLPTCLLSLPASSMAPRTRAQPPEFPGPGGSRLGSTQSTPESFPREKKTRLQP